MERIYFDNAATTALDEEVLQAMMPYLTEKFGNPSSIYSYGRESKMAIEGARKSVAKILNCTPGEIFFTSGGTESTNTALHAAIHDLDCTQIITSPLEHHATLHTVESIAKKGWATLAYVKVNDKGQVDLNHLEELLQHHNGRSLITLMHANNEVGNLLPIERVGEIAEKYNAIFHSDTVQTVGHYPIDLQQLKVHFINGAGHKFHGPKGVGILFVRNTISIQPLLHGGAQERNMRAGTENLYGIVGFAKALELADQRMQQDSAYIQELKTYMREQLNKEISGLRFNGDEDNHCLYTVLNVGFPKTNKTEMLLMNLDMSGICVSGGSACSSGATSVSHVIQAILGDKCNDLVPIRFSFCRHNTKQEVDKVIHELKKVLQAA